MPAGFSPSLAFGAGLASGIETTEAAKVARQNQIDDEYRKSAISVDAEKELYDYKNKKQQQQKEQDASDIASILQSNKQNSSNKATFDALNNNRTPNLPQTPTGPTNTPNTQGAAPVQGQGQIQQNNLPPLSNQSGGMNPTGNPPVNSTIPQNATPSVPVGGGPAANPLQPPTSPVNSQAAQQSLQNAGPGSISPNQDDDIVNSYKGNPLSREDAAIIGGYAAEEKEKSNGYLTNEQAIAVGYARWKDNEAKQSKTDSRWSGDSTDISKANQLGVPYVKDPGFERLDAKTQTNIQEADTKRLFGSQDEQRAIGLLPVLSTDLKTLYQLNQSITTGNVKALPGGTTMASALDSYNALYDKISNVLAIYGRAPGLGRMSVAELTADQKGFASLKVPNDANNSIILTKLAMAQRKAEQVDFQKKVISATGHYDDGVYDQIWDKYDRSNPVLDLSNPVKPQVLDYTPRESFMRGNDSDKTNILSDVNNNIKHNINTPQNTSKAQVMTLDKQGKPQFDFSGY